MLLRGRLGLFGGGRQADSASGSGEEGGEPGRIADPPAPGFRSRESALAGQAGAAGCGLGMGEAGEGAAGWAAAAGPAGVPGLAFSVFSIDGLAFMELLNHRFEKRTVHRGYKMQAEKRG